MAMLTSKDKRAAKKRKKEEIVFLFNNYTSTRE
jgi:hypothetical protein